VRNIIDPRFDTQSTEVFSVEVLDGKFTLSNGGTGQPCGNVGWVKLDLITASPFPSAWLPAPTHEWWQMELRLETDAHADADADAAASFPPVGLVEIVQPHSPSVSFGTYGTNTFSDYSPDCRTWWLYGPAKCYR
jgi:hypothetical protein